MEQSLQDKLARNQRVQSGAIDWMPLKEPGIEGIYVKPLRFDPEQNRVPTFMLKLDPGASYPAHNHPAGEEVFVLEGEVQLGRDYLSVGDYLYTAPGNRHSVKTEAGCVLLLNVPEAVELLKGPETSP